ncbi:MAG TPA: hypothetical protein VF182_16540 [Candidatus Binatia bacterium]
MGNRQEMFVDIPKELGGLIAAIVDWCTTFQVDYLELRQLLRGG